MRQVFRCYWYYKQLFIFIVVPRHHIISDVLVYLQHGTKSQNLSDFSNNLYRRKQPSPSLPLTQEQQSEYIKLLQNRFITHFKGCFFPILSTSPSRHCTYFPFFSSVQLFFHVNNHCIIVTMTFELEISQFLVGRTCLSLFLPAIKRGERSQNICSSELRG